MHGGVNTKMENAEELNISKKWALDWESLQRTNRAWEATWNGFVTETPIMKAIPKITASNTVLESTKTILEIAAGDVIATAAILTIQRYLQRA